MKDQDFLAEALKRGYLTEDKIPAVEETQKQVVAKGLSLSLPEILVMKGLLTRSQADMIKNGSVRAGATMFGKYEIGQKLGEGGMGIVYRATKVDAPDRPVALKIL